MTVAQPSRLEQARQRSVALSARLRPGVDWSRRAGGPVARWVWWLARETGHAEARGASRAGRALHRWYTATYDFERVDATTARSEADDVTEALQECRKLARHRKERVFFLSVMFGALLVGAAILAGPVLVGLGSAGALGLGFLLAGWRPDPGHVTENVDTGRITRERVVTGLGSISSRKIDAALKDNPSGKGWFLGPIRRDGPGYVAELDLPHGATVTELAARKTEFSSGLRIPEECVWPERGRRSAAHLILWLGDKPLREQKSQPWPAASDAMSLFEPIPFGTDVRGQTITITLFEFSVLIGAAPGMGKSFALRLLLLAGALDPTAELRIFDFKGTGDHRALKPVATHYGCGPDTDTLDACLHTLGELHDDLGRRAKVIDGLSTSRCPEDKVTPELAADPELGLHPVLLGIDELQVLFRGHTSTRNKRANQAAELTTGIIERGRALGVIPLLATQRPSADTLPTSVRANVSRRFCLRVTDHDANDMILGDGSHKLGLQATRFVIDDRGIGYLRGEADLPRVMRTFEVDHAAAEDIVMRAIQLRRAVAGQAAEPAVSADALVTAAHGCLNGDAELSLGDLLARLHDAGHCAGWDTTRLGRELGKRGVTRPPRKRLHPDDAGTVRWVGRQHLEEAM